MAGAGDAERGTSDVQIRTFLIADVRGYTLFTQERGDEAAAKLAARFGCDLSGSIVAEGTAVTFHLARPDPDLPFKLALPPAFPVPASTPATDRGLEPVPATGPYMIAEARAGTIELVRNPVFREWSGAAQPDGFVDTISWRFGGDLGIAFDAVSAGELDWLTEAPEPPDLAQMLAAHPAQVVLSQAPATLYVGFRVDAAPFDEPRVRQALNLAIDRDRVTELMGGTEAYLPTCQILPPGFQGYEPFCPTRSTHGTGCGPRRTRCAPES